MGWAIELGDGEAVGGGGGEKKKCARVGLSDRMYEMRRRFKGIISSCVTNKQSILLIKDTFIYRERAIYIYKNIIL